MRDAAEYVMKVKSYLAHKKAKTYKHLRTVKPDFALRKEGGQKKAVRCRLLGYCV